MVNILQEEIMLNDLLNFSYDETDKVKIKFNQTEPESGDDPLDLYLRDSEIVNTQWLFWRDENRYFAEGQIALCFVKLGGDRWLLTTIKDVTRDLDVKNGVSFEGTEIEKYRKYFGRVIVRYHKTAPTQGYYYKTVCNDLIVDQVLPDTFDKGRLAWMR